MASRPIWSGSITFGLVNVPVRLYSATSHTELRFHMLHDEDGGRIREKRVCSIDGKEVAYEHIMKGYPLSKHEYVPIQREELATLTPKSSKTIDIEDFVELKEIDPIFYDNTYFLLPDRGAAKAYGLLLVAIEKTRMVGIAKVVLRTKQYLCALRPMAGVLALSTMHWADELVSASDLELPEAPHKPSERELGMATKLVESLVTRFKPEKYRDEYREQVLALIEKKARGEKVVTEEEAPTPTPTRDLADALAASLEHIGKRRGATNEEPSETRGEKRHRAPQAARRTRAHAKR